MLFASRSAQLFFIMLHMQQLIDLSCRPHESHPNPDPWRTLNGDPQPNDRSGLRVRLLCALGLRDFTLPIERVQSTKFLMLMTSCRIE